MSTLLTSINLSQSELVNLCIKPLTCTGSVESMDELPKVPTVGEVRFHNPSGSFYVWDGKQWDDMYETASPGYVPRLGDTPFPDGPKQKEYPDLTCESGLYHLIKCWFNFIFGRLKWNVQLA